MLSTFVFCTIWSVIKLTSEDGKRCVLDNSIMKEGLQGYHNNVVQSNNPRIKGWLLYMLIKSCKLIWALSFKLWIP